MSALDGLSFNPRFRLVHIFLIFSNLSLSNLLVFTVPRRIMIDKQKWGITLKFWNSFSRMNEWMKISNYFIIQRQNCRSIVQGQNFYLARVVL